MIKSFELEVDDPKNLPALTDFEILKRMKNEATCFDVSDIRQLVILSEDEVEHEDVPF